MILNARRDWITKVWFELRPDHVPRGRYWPVSVSEDENFSRMVQREGGKVYATRKVAVEHRGVGRFRNDRVWGFETDAAYAALTGEGSFKP